MAAKEQYKYTVDEGRILSVIGRMPGGASGNLARAAFLVRNPNLPPHPLKLMAIANYLEVVLKSIEGHLEEKHRFMNEAERYSREIVTIQTAARIILDAKSTKKR